MPTRATLAIVAAIALAAQAHAQGDQTPLFTSFKAFCIDTGAKPNAVKAAVESAGGKLDLSPVGARFPDYATVTTWAHFVGDRKLTIQAITQSVPPGRNAGAAHRCIVRSFGNEDARIVAIRDWVGVPPIGTTSSISTHYAFLNLGSERVPITDTSDRARSAMRVDGGWGLVLDQGQNFGSAHLSHELPANP